jgi:Cytochrome c554 and c-prime
VIWHPMRRASWLAALAVWLPAAAAGAPQCATCHRDQAQVQPGTDMASALLPPDANHVLKAHPDLKVQRGPYTYRVETRDGKSIYSVSDGRDTMSEPIRWAFGTRSQTWVFERGGRFYESLVSYYAPIANLDLTIGDAAIEPHTLAEAFGRELSDFETRSCFNCHATNAVAGDHLRLDGVIPGVQCERCHVGADRHAQGVAQGKTEAAPPRLAALSPEETSNFCGQCHRTWERVVRDRLRGPINVRFQPYRLANSKCYDGGDRRMSCTTCHEPHHQLVQGPASYDARCQSCHNRAADGRSRKVCPVGTNNCTNCHMPKVELPGAHMVFRDHQIRIVRPGDTYPN